MYTIQDTKKAITNAKNAKDLQEAFKEENNFYKDVLRQLGEGKVTKLAEFSARELAKQYEVLLDNKIRELDKTKDKANTSLKEMYKKEKKEFQKSLKKNPLFKTAKSVAELEKKREDLSTSQEKHIQKLLVLLNEVRKKGDPEFKKEHLKDFKKANSPIKTASENLGKKMPEETKAIVAFLRKDQKRLKRVNKLIEEAKKASKAPSRESNLDRKAISRMKESLARNQGQVYHARITGPKKEVYKGR